MPWGDSYHSTSQQTATLAAWHRRTKNFNPAVAQAHELATFAIQPNQAAFAVLGKGANRPEPDGWISSLDIRLVCAVAQGRLPSNEPEFALVQV